MNKANDKTKAVTDKEPPPQSNLTSDAPPTPAEAGVAPERENMQACNNPSSEPKNPPDTRPAVPTINKELFWIDENRLRELYPALGKQLAQGGDLYRNVCSGVGLIMVPASPTIRPLEITTAQELAAIVADRIVVNVVKQGKPKGGQIPSSHLTTMLRTELFLREFLPLDIITNTPMYLPDFTLTQPGYNDGGVGCRIYYRGAPALVTYDFNINNQFLDEMAFATHADRTNTVAALLTVMLRSRWPGARPVIVVTSNKSQAGKNTIVLFVAGCNVIVSISYTDTDWALEKAFVAAIKYHPETAVVHVDNARLQGRDKCIASAFLERIVTDPEPLLFSPGGGAPTSGRNDLVVAITTNFGSLSADLLNRSLPIHLEITGDVEHRKSAIGDPKLEFLPAHRADIEAAVHGMIAKWVAAGRPLDLKVRHPFVEWARVVGGILMVNGYQDFLGNYSQRKAADDPVREALGTLGGARPGAWLTAGEWAELSDHLALSKTLIRDADRGSPEGRARGLGRTMRGHIGETLHTETDNEVMTLRLGCARRRFENGVASKRYQFVVLERTTLPADDAAAAAVTPNEATKP